jgi:autotransporter-associated beta strand protein
MTTLAKSSLAASQTWNYNAADSNWANSEDWGIGSSTPPGSNSGTTSTDIATFNNDSTVINVTNDPGRNIGGIVFDTTAYDYTIGSAGGNTLYLSGGGTIEVAPTFYSSSGTFMAVNAPLQLEGNATIANWGVNMDFGGSITGSASGGTLSILGVTGGTFSGVISDGGSPLSLTFQTYANTWTLNAANTYSGTTSFLSGNANLNFSNGSDTTTNIINPTSALVLGGSLTVTGNPSGGNSQTFAGITLLPGASLTDNSNGSNSTLINLGAIHRDPLGTITVTNPGTGALSAINGITTSTPNDASGILGGWATVSSTNFATNTGTYITGYASATPLPAAGFSNTTNYSLTASQTLTGSGSISTLAINPSAASQSLAIPSGATLTLADGGLLLPSGNSSGYTISGGALQGASGDALYIWQNNTGSLTISSQIADNNTSGLLKEGGGFLYLTNPANNYAGTTVIGGGTINFVNGAIGSSGNITFDGGPGFLQYATGNTQDVSSRIANSTDYIAIDTNGNSITFGSGLAASNVGGFRKYGLGTLTLLASSSYTGATVLNAGTVVAENPAAFGNTTKLQISASVSLDLATDTSINPYNLSTAGNSTFSTAVDILSDRYTPNSPGITQQLGQLVFSNTNPSSIWAQAGANVLGGSPAVAFQGAGGGNTSSISVFLPMSANISVGTFIGNEMNLAGVTQNNQVTGVINAVGNDTYLNTNLIKNGASTWTIGIEEAYLGQTGISGGTLDVTNPLTFANGSTITINGGGALKLESDTSTAFTTSASYKNVISGTAYIDVDPITPGNAAQTITLSNLQVTNGNYPFMVTSSNSNPYTLAVTTLSSTAPNPVALDPTTGNLAIGTLVPAAVVELEGSSAGSTIGAISNASAAEPIYKWGSGTWTVNGNAGTLAVTGVNIYSGTIVEDLTSQQTNKFPSTSDALDVLGGNFILAAPGGSTSTSQTFSAASANGGAYSTLTVNNVASLSTGGTVVNLTALTSSTNNGGVINFALPSGTQSSANGITTSSTNTNGILVGTSGDAGKFIVNGTDWATNATNTAGGNIIAYSGYTGINALGGTIAAASGSLNLSFNTGGTSGDITLAGSGTTTVNTLKQNSTGSITISPGTGNTLVTGALLIPAGMGSVTIGDSANGVGTLLAPVSTTADEIVFINNSANSLTINSLVAAPDDIVVAGSGTGITYLTNAGNTIGSLIPTNGAVFIDGNATVNITADADLGTAPTSLKRNVTLGGGTLQLGGNITFNAFREFYIYSTGGTIDTNGNSGTISAIVTGQSANQFTLAGNFTKAGNGTLYLTNTANTLPGRTFVIGGDLNIAADASLGTAPTYVIPDSLNLNGGTLQFAAASAFNLTTNRGITLGASGGTIDTNGVSTLYAGVMTGTGGFTKTGAGSLYLTGYNSFTGKVTVNQGTLAINTLGSNSAAPAAQSLGLGTGTITLGNASSPTNSAELLYAASGSINSTAFTTTGGNDAMLDRPITVATGDSATIGNTSGLQLTIDSVSNNIAINGTNLTLAGTGSGGTFLIGDPITSTGSLTVNGSASVTLSSASSTFTGSTIVNTGTLNITGALLDSNSVAVNATSAQATLLLSGADALPATAAITGTTTGSAVPVITANAGQTIASISSGGTTTFTAGTSIVGTGNGVGTGTSGTLTTGGISGGGTLTVNGAANLYAATISQTVLNIGSASTVTIADSAGPGNTAATSVLTDLYNNGTLDLKNNDLIVLDTTQYSTVKSLIVNAYDSGAWDQPGITSSSARANSGSYALGYAQASTIGSTSFDGHTFTDAVLVKYTLLGDSQLRGTVGIGDYDTVLSNYGTPQDWSGGDFHYGGVVGIGDYDDVLSNYGAHASGNLAPSLTTALTRSVGPAASISPDLAKTDLKLEVNTTTGDVYLLATASAAFTGYTISDPTAHLLGGSTSPDPDKLLSVAAGNGGNTNVYETSGTYVDWFKITETASQVAEGQQQNGFGTHSSRDDTINIPAGGTIDFGNIYNTAAQQQDLTFDFAEAGTEPTNGPTYYGAEVDYVTTPEPALLGLIGLGGVMMMRRRRRNA